MKRRRAPAATTKIGSKDVAKVDALFNAYLPKDKKTEDVMGPDGVEKFLGDLKLDPTDRKVLLLAWRFDAKHMGYFSREEFRTGFQLLNANSIAQLKKALPSLEVAVQDPDQLQSFYQFAFRFCLTEPGQKIIDIETAAQMLELVLPGGRFVEPFCRYLRLQNDYKKISRDVWQGFFRFSRDIKPDLSDYDLDGGAWPVILDQFVEWLRSSPAELPNS